MATTTDNAATRVTGEELARRARRKELRDRWMWRILGYVAVLGAWEFVSGRFLEEALLPGPTRVIRTFGEIWSSGKLPGAFADTLTRLFIGFGLSFIIGAVIGIISQNRW